jgi:hypothetical protein
MQRPFGVTVLAMLSLVSGLWGILKGLFAVGVGGVVAALVAGAHPIAGAMVGVFAVVIGIVAVLTGLFCLLFAYGAWNLRPWAWTLGVVTNAITLVWSLLVVLGPGLLRERLGTIIVSMVILYYLTTPQIKKAFGRT